MVAGLEQSGLGLPDRDYYLKDDKKFIETRAQYLKYIEKLYHLQEIHKPRNMLRKS